MQRFSFKDMIDLSFGDDVEAEIDPWKPKLRYLTHAREKLGWIKSQLGVIPPFGIIPFTMSVVLKTA